MKKYITLKLGKPYSVTTDVAVELAHAMNMSIEELLLKIDGKQEFITNENISKNKTIQSDIEISSNKKYYMCPVYGKIVAEQPNWAEECIEGRFPLDYEFMGIQNPEEYFFLQVNGESMNRIVKNGAYALIHRQDVVENGEIAVILVNGDEATLKHFSKQGEIIVLTPESDDETIKQQIYTKETPIKVIGKYIGKFEINKR